MATDQRERDVEYVMTLNEKLADEVSFLRDEIRFLREVLFKALDKQRNQVRATDPQESQEPIPGYVSTKNRIADLEKESRDRYEKDKAQADFLTEKDNT